MGESIQSHSPLWRMLLKPDIRQEVAITLPLCLPCTGETHARVAPGVLITLTKGHTQQDH